MPRKIKKIDSEKKKAAEKKSNTEYIILKENNKNKILDFKGKNTSFYRVIKKSPDFLEKFKKAKSSQKTASTYHVIFQTSYENDKVFYRRNQSKHPFSDIKNSSNIIVDRLKDSGILLGDKKFLHNFGLFSSFSNGEKEITSDDNRPVTNKAESSSKKELDSRILDHKNKAVRFIVKHKSFSKLKTIIVDETQVSANYPCVIIKFNSAYKWHKIMKEKEILNEYDQAYPEFLTHLIISCINYEIYKFKIGIYFDRRQSFGFLTPTASDVGPAIRLSLGLVPNKKWMIAVQNGILEFDKILDSLWDKKALTIDKASQTMGNPYAKFRSGKIAIYGHKIFLMSFLKIDKIGNLIGMNNSRDLVSLVNSLCLNYDEIISSVEKGNFFNEFSIEIKKGLSKTKDCPSTEKSFNDIYQMIYSIYRSLNKSDTKDPEGTAFSKMQSLEDEIKLYKESSVESVYKLEQIQITSESPEDLESNDGKPITNVKKHYSPTGMSALSVPLFAYQQAFFNKKLKDSSDIIKFKVEKYSYFELASWDKKKLSKRKVTKTDKAEEADIIYLDNNPCVNDASSPINCRDFINALQKSYSNAKYRPKMLVIDITSSTQEQFVQIKNVWKDSGIPILCFAASGLKNYQFGLDMAQYGENRIFINDRYLTELSKEDQKEAIEIRKNCDSFIKKMREITRASSSVYATHVRRELREKSHSVFLPKK